uniref:Uncharacterized protein n=1 Tax=Vitis vinifera TaxID=29760 RepID=F6I5N2_VITVI
MGRDRFSSFFFFSDLILWTGRCLVLFNTWQQSMME